jgi:VWFA-related protein
MRRRLAVLALVVVSWGTSALCLLEASRISGQQQSQAPTFQATTTYIQVDAHVVDGRGRFVRGLQKGDFRVLEDGQAQQVEDLELVDLSEDAADSIRAPLPQKGSEEPVSGRNVVSRARRRVYYLVIDDLHVRPERTAVARQLADDFLRRVPRPDDLVGMLLTSGIGGAIHPSLDRQPLLDRIQRILGKKLRSAASASAVELDSQNQARIAQARAALEALGDAVRDAASTAEGRKTLVLISEGVDPPAGAETGAQLRDVSALANRAGVSVYPLDARGVAGRLRDNIDAGGREFTADVLLAEERASQEILEDMAASTDGLAFVKTSNFAGAFDRIKADSSTYYLLSYRRPATAAKGYHRIEVRVNRPGVTVRARTEYDDRLPLSLPAPSAPPPAPPAQTARPTPEPTPIVAAHENPLAPAGAPAPLANQPPTYIILIDSESFGEEEARKACAVTGAFVDGLDPDDRVVILSVASGVGPVEAGRDRLAAGGALASIVETAAARPRERWTLIRAIEIAGDPALVDRMAAGAASVYDRDAFQRARQDILSTASQVIKRYAKFLAMDPLAPATTRLLSEQDTFRPTAVVWLSNRPRLLTGGASGTDRGLIDAAVAAHVRVSFVTTLSTDLTVRLQGSGSHTLMEGYASIVSGTGGVLVRGVSSVDAAAGTLLKATQALGRRRADPAGRSELTSLRRAAERPLKSPYAALVRQYLTGDADAAVRVLLSWPPEQVAASVYPLSSRAELDAAIALHTEAGCRSGSAAVFEQHFWITQRAMAAVVSRMRNAPLRRHWIRAIATASAQHARQIAPGDREIESAVLVALGAQMEAPTDALREAQSDFDHPRVPEADLARAAATYREALALNDDLWEARLRLGSVLGRLHKTDEAMAQLERVRTQASDPRFRYLASLSLGQISENAGGSEAARAAYDEAIRALPDGFVARVALARLLESSGRAAEGRKVMQEALARQAGRHAESDPWHEYLYSSLAQMERHLAALRDAARRESEVAR